MHSRNRFKSRKSHSKKRFTPDEDKIIISLVKPNYENDWARISKSLDKRTARQCRDRWCNYLDPSLNRKEWLPEEDDKLMKLFEQKGPQWKFFSIILNGRSINDVRNRYFKLVRKSLKLSKNNGKKKESHVKIEKKEILDDVVPIETSEKIDEKNVRKNYFDQEIFSNFDNFSFDFNELIHEFEELFEK